MGSHSILSMSMFIKSLKSIKKMTKLCLVESMANIKHISRQICELMVRKHILKEVAGCE